MHIKPEDIEITREQQEYVANLGCCDICKAQEAKWEMVFAWRRTLPYLVPALVTHALICSYCHDHRSDTLEYVRAFLEKQAHYRAEQIQQSIAGPERKEYIGRVWFRNKHEADVCSPAKHTTANTP